MEDLPWFRHAVLRHRPQRHALMLPPDGTTKYLDRPYTVSDTLLRQHLAGTLTLAAPAAHADLSCLLPLDVDAGGLAAIQALLAAATAQRWWAFAQFCPRPDWPDAAQRGYVWLVFDELTAARRLAALGDQLVAQALRTVPDARIEVRCHHADTRLPLGKHTHTGLFGDLLLPDGTQVSIDADPVAALVLLRDALNENPVAWLPAAPAEAAHAPLPVPGDANLIRRYNAETDLRGLLTHYSGRRASYRLFHCPCSAHSNGDATPSLGLVRSREDRYGPWLAKGFAPHCAFHRATDAFGVYCILEGIDAAEGVKRLAALWGLNNGREARSPGATPPVIADSEDGPRRPLHAPAMVPQLDATHAERIRSGMWLRLAQDTMLPASARTVCVALLQAAQDRAQAYCQLTIQRLADLAHLATRTVQLACRRLAAAGYLTVQPDATPNGGDRANIYAFGGIGPQQIHPPACMDSPPIKLTMNHGKRKTPNESLTGRGGRQIAGTGAVGEESTQSDQQPLPPLAAQPPSRRVEAALPPSDPALVAQIETILGRADASWRWLTALRQAGIGFVEAAQIAMTAGRRAFARGDHTTGRKRLWQARQLRERAATETVPPIQAAPTVDSAPAARPSRPDSGSAEGTPSAARLTALGLYPASVRRLAAVPLAIVERAIALAEAAPGGRDVASLVVGFLTAHLEGWTIPDPVPSNAVAAEFDLAKYTTGKYAGFFHVS